MRQFITVRNEVANVMFLQVCVCSQEGVVSQHPLQVVSQHALQQVSRGMLSQHALQVVSQHDLQQVSRGSLLPGGCLLWGGVVLLRGVPAPAGVGLLLGRCACSRGVPAPGGLCGDPSESRRLLLRTVRIILECILVVKFFAFSGDTETTS